MAESFAGFGSTMGDDEIVAVFDTEGSAYAAGIASVSWNETEAPDANGAGRGARERAERRWHSWPRPSEPFVPAGIASVMTTPAGSVEGPSFVSVMV